MAWRQGACIQRHSSNAVCCLSYLNNQRISRREQVMALGKVRVANWATKNVLCQHNASGGLSWLRPDSLTRDTQPRRHTGRALRHSWPSRLYRLTRQLPIGVPCCPRFENTKSDARFSQPQSATQNGRFSQLGRTRSRSTVVPRHTQRPE